MTKNRAIFGAEFTEKLLQFFCANLPVNGLLRRKGMLIKQQPGNWIIVGIFASDLGYRKRRCLAADQPRSLFCGNAKRLCNFLCGASFLKAQPLCLLDSPHFILGKRHCTEILIEITMHPSEQKRL